MAWSVESCREKVRRVDENLKALDEANGAYIATHPYTIAPEFDIESEWHRVILNIVRPPGPEFGLIIGEAAHNLRSALDHLAWQLATLDGDPPDPKRVQFPILGQKPKDFHKHRSVNGMRWEHRTVLEGLQPYHTGHSETYLKALAWINNTDKHRVLHTTASSATQLVPHVLKPYEGYEIVRSEFGYEGLLEGSTEIGRVLVRPASAELKVYMQIAPTIGVNFGELGSPVFGFSADGLLRKIKEHVLMLIDLFDRPGMSGEPPWPS